MAPLFFETQRFEVVIANEMAEGFSRAMGGRLHINILDAEFTGGSGVELARRTRAFAPAHARFLFGQSSPGGGSGIGGSNVNKMAEFGSRLW
jgi:DNA-binding response OmpR family regulator